MVVINDVVQLLRSRNNGFHLPLFWAFGHFLYKNTLPQITILSLNRLNTILPLNLNVSHDPTLPYEPNSTPKHNYPQTNTRLNPSLPLYSAPLALLLHKSTPLLNPSLLLTQPRHYPRVSDSRQEKYYLFKSRHHR